MSEVNKIANYNQMMSWLTRPSVPKTETRENFKYGTVPGEGNSRIEYDPEIDTYRKRVQETVDGKKTTKYIFSESGQSLGDFKKIKPVRSTGAEDATVKARQYIDNWTKNWFDNNLKNYGVKDFDAMIDGLSSNWQLELESGNVPKGKGSFNLSTPQLNLPNITSGRDATTKKGNIKPFNYNDVEFYANLESSPLEKSKTLSQYRKVFYKNKIESNPQLREGLNKFFNFMSADKRGLYLKLDGKTIKDFMNTEVSDEVKFLLDPDISGLGKTSKKEVFNSYSDLADNYNKFTEDKVRLKAVQAETEAVAKAGKKTADQYKKVKADIAKQNDVLAKMSVKEIANNKELLNSVRMSINPKTGDVSYTNYTVNDPKKKTALTDLELAEKIKQKAKNKNFYVTEHIGKKSFNKANLAFPNNIQSANYMSNAQLENARRFLIIPENRNTPAAQNLDKTLEDLKLTIRGPEYGNKPIGNKIKIEVDSKTGVSNIVQDQLINNKTPIVNNLTETIPGVTTADKLGKPPATVEKEMFKKATNRFKNQRGFIDPALLGADKITEGIDKLKIYGPDYAKQILNTTRNIGKVAVLPELVFGAGLAPLDLGEGRTAKETLLNAATLGAGIPINDALDRTAYAKKFGLDDILFQAQMKEGKKGDNYYGYEIPNLTDSEKLALEKAKEFDEKVLESRLEKKLKERKDLTQEMQNLPDADMRSGAMNGGIMRLGFADGPKDPKMNRRTFMKVMGGLASIPILGRLMKPAAKVVESAAPVIQRSVEGVPEFLMDLIAKVKLKAADKRIQNILLVIDQMNLQRCLSSR